MAVFNIVRAGRRNEGYMEELIQKMHSDSRVVFRQGYGVPDRSPEFIINTFYWVRNTYAKINSVKVHYMEIFMEHGFGLANAKRTAEHFGKYLYQEGFQSFISILETEKSYIIAIAVNAVSFWDGRLFHDNNAHYQVIFQYLRSVMPLGCQLSASENSFFHSLAGVNQYQHGLLD